MKSKALAVALAALPSDECVLWTGSIDRRGYGRVSHQGKGRGAHRVVWELTQGVLEPGEVLDHLCRTPPCINPWHLEPVSMAENTARGRDLRGVANARTHCVHGHLYDEENTYIRSDGCRDCRTCIRERVARYAAKNRSVA